MKKLKNEYWVAILIIIGAFLRFYNLNWGAPYYFHPDERNIVDLVLKSSLTNPQSLLKGTFAYGNFPMILTLIIKPLFLLFFHLSKIVDTFAQIVIILRFISAFFSILALYFIYLCGKFWSEKTGLLALFFSVFSTGLIQQAHFGTYDGFGAFCAITIFYLLLRLIKTKNLLYFYLSIIVLCLGVATKINLIILAIFPLGSLLYVFKKHKNRIRALPLHAGLGVLILALLTIALSPNYLTVEFKNALIYEQGLVRGSVPVFYTQSFFGTTPIIFQFLHILPFLINPLMTIIFIPAFFYILIKGLKTKNKSFLLLNSYFLILFFPQAFFFAKWTRYMVPVLPFMYLIVAIALTDVIARSETTKQSLKNTGLPRSLQSLAMTITLLACVLFGISYFITAFVRPDTRVAASNFAGENIPRGARILTEPYDLGIMPFNGLSTNIVPFNFYEFDTTSPEATESILANALSNSNYIILPSQRLLRSRLLNKDKFPKGNSIYSLLTNEALGFQKIYETPCDIFCKIAYLGDPTFQFEETATVFDRPTVFVFKKIK